MTRFSTLALVLAVVLSGCRFRSSGTANSSDGPDMQGSKSSSGQSSARNSIASAFSAALGIDLGARELEEFRTWLDKGADSSKIPKILPTSDKQAVDVVREFDRAFPGAPAVLVRTKSGSWSLILGGGNYGDSKFDYCLLIEEKGEVRWISHKDVRQLWDGLAVVLRGDARPLKQPLWTHQPEIDLGEIQDQSGKVETLLVNRTSSVVTISDAKFDCSCGNVVFHEESIPAFGIVRARISVNATGKAEGPLGLRLLITTRPAAETPLLITVKATVVQPTHLMPAVVDVGNVVPTSKPLIVESVLHVKRPPAGDVFPAYLPDGIRWKGSIREGDKSVRIQLEVDPARVPLGNFRLATAIGLRDKNDRTETLHSLPISGRRLPVIQFAPVEVLVGRCRPGQKFHRSVRVFHGGADPIQVTSTNFQGVVPKVEGESMELKIEAPGRTGPFEVIVFVRAGDAYALLPVRGVVEREASVADSGNTNPEIKD